MDQFFEPKRKLASMFWKREAPRKFKNEWSVMQVVLMAFWNCCNLVYAEFDPDTCKEKRNVCQDNHFVTLMNLRNAIQSKRQRLLSQKVVSIHVNACPQRVRIAE